MFEKRPPPKKPQKSERRGFSLSSEDKMRNPCSPLQTDMDPCHFSSYQVLSVLPGLEGSGTQQNTGEGPQGKKQAGERVPSA